MRGQRGYSKDHPPSESSMAPHCPHVKCPILVPTRAAITPCESALLIPASTHGDPDMQFSLPEDLPSLCPPRLPTSCHPCLCPAVLPSWPAPCGTPLPLAGALKPCPPPDSERGGQGPVSGLCPQCPAPGQLSRCLVEGSRVIQLHEWVGAQRQETRGDTQAQEAACHRLGPEPCLTSTPKP